MKLKEIHELAIKVGIEADPRKKRGNRRFAKKTKRGLQKTIRGR